MTYVICLLMIIRFYLSFGYYFLHFLYLHFIAVALFLFWSSLWQLLLKSALKITNKINLYHKGVCQPKKILKTLCNYMVGSSVHSKQCEKLLYYLTPTTDIWSITGRGGNFRQFLITLGIGYSHFWYNLKTDIYIDIFWEINRYR